MAWLLNSTSRDYVLDSTGNFTRDTTPYTRAWIALNTPRGSMWWDPEFGEGLTALERGLDKGKETEKAVVDDIARTLQFLVDEGEIVEVTTKTQRSAANKILVDTVMRGGDGAVYKVPRRVLGAYAEHW
jgi:hypothetical protein